MSNAGQKTMARSMVAKRLLFRQPNVTKVYPDPDAQHQSAGSVSGPGPISTDAAKGTRKLLASFDSDESAYQSGDSSPAATGPQPARVGSDETASSSSTVTTAASGVSPKSALERLTPLDVAAVAEGSEGTASLGCIELGELRIVKPSEPEQKQECNCQQPAGPRTVSGRCVHFSNKNPSSDNVSEVDAAINEHTEDDEVEEAEDQTADAATEAEFRDRLKRLFGLQHRPSGDASASVSGAADASGSAVSIDPDSNIDLRQFSRQEQRLQSAAAAQPRSRRQSLAARIFGRLPTALGGRRLSQAGDGSGGVGSAADLGSEATDSTTGGFCSVCGEPNCEAHAEMDDGCWPRRHLRLLGCYKTKEERERAQMLENNLVAQVTTIIVVLIFLGLMIGLIVLATTASSKSTASTATTVSTTTASATLTTFTTASTVMTTTGSGGNTTA